MKQHRKRGSTGCMFLDAHVYRKTILPTVAITLSKRNVCSGSKSRAQVYVENLEIPCCDHLRD